jgi:putative SOS response-associated peptidase YedK
MCARFTQHHTAAQITERFKIARVLFFAGPRFNIAPTQTVSVVMQETERVLAGCGWGLIPSWARDASMAAKLINARAETLAEKPSFRQALARRRCLIPADGFYEWKAEGKARQPWHIRLKENRLFALAGLWDEWRGPEGTPLRTCTIVTVIPNALIASIHDRMPAILRPEHETGWLDSTVSDAAELTRWLQPYPSEEMERYRVSRRVNSAAIDQAGCLEPEGQQDFEALI